jgi:hypothetical protein
VGRSVVGAALGLSVDTERGLVGATLGISVDIEGELVGAEQPEHVTRQLL